MHDDRCYGCGVDYLTLPIGAPCPAAPPPGSVCVQCGGPLEPRRTGRPPKRCMGCSKNRQAYAKKTPDQRRAESRDLAARQDRR